MPQLCSKYNYSYEKVCFFELNSVANYFLIYQFGARERARGHGQTFVNPRRQSKRVHKYEKDRFLVLLTNSLFSFFFFKKKKINLCSNWRVAAARGGAARRGKRDGASAQGWRHAASRVGRYEYDATVVRCAPRSKSLFLLFFKKITIFFSFTFA